MLSIQYSSSIIHTIVKSNKTIMETQNKIKVVLLLSLFLFLGTRIHAQKHYRVVDRSGNNIKNKGIPIKVGDLYRDGQHKIIDWPNRGSWLEVTRDGYDYLVNRNGIKKNGNGSSKHVQPIRRRDLTHKGWETISGDSIIHYSQRNYYLIGKKDYLYFERKSREENVKIEAVLDKPEGKLSMPIECITIDRACYYVITPKIFRSQNTVDSLKLSIRETKEGYIYNEYTHGLKIVYYP